MLSIRTILHPTDFSECSKAAFRMACSLARYHNARVIVLHVLTPPPVMFDEFGNTSFETNRVCHEANEAKAREQLHWIRPADLNVQVEHQLEEGNPVDLIPSIAEWENCDLIAMGTHGRRGLMRLLMGSVAENVLRKAPCPVLLVKAPAPKEEPAERTERMEFCEAK